MTRLAVVGTGLIGASVGLAARRAGVEDVRGWDPDRAHLATAAERGAVEPAVDLGSALEDAAIAVVAAPVTALPAQVRAVLDASAPSVTVTDVGSTKGGVCAAAAGVGRFVGGHPICGSEARGPEWATAELFEGATWFLTPVAATDPDSYKALHGFVSALGAVPVAIDPDAHDRLVAVTSHLPHALANVLLNQAGAPRSTGTTARRGWRLAPGHDPRRGANPRIWVDIFLENREALAASLAEPPAARAARGRAGRRRRRLPRVGSGRPPRTVAACSRPRTRTPGALQRLRVHVPDRPGVIAGIAQALGAERINIADFDLQHLSSERGGTLAILVAGEGEAERAAALLEQQGYGVVVAPVLEDES